MAATKSPSKTPSKKLKAGKKKSLNKWILIGGAAVIAIVGVVVVRFSGAATPDQAQITYKIPLSSISGGQTTKVNGASQRLLLAGQDAGTFISAAQLATGDQVCAYFTLATSTAKIQMVVGNGREGGVTTSGTYSGLKTPHYLCGGKGYQSSGITVTPLTGNIYLHYIYMRKR